MTSEILHYVQILRESIKDDYKNFTVRSHHHSLEKDPESDYHKECLNQIREGKYNYNFDIEVEEGKKYLKLVMVSHTNRSVHCFIDKTNGNVLKAASWKTPAKGVRYNLLNSESRENCFKNADWSGHYLYMR